MAQHDVPHLLAVLVALLVATKALGLVAQRFGQPSVVGELIAGVILGKSALGILDPSDPVIHTLAALGVIVLLFEIGLSTDIRSLVAVGGEALSVAVVGVVLPFALGFGVCILLGLPTLPSIIAGAALTATSIGISARTLADLGRLRSAEGQIVLGAAVIDDVIGLVIFSVVGGIVGGVMLTFSGIATTTAIAIGFIGVALILGRLVVPPVFRFIDRLEASGTLGVAGLVPIFFAAVGAEVALGAFSDLRVIAIGMALLAAALVGKVASGYAPFWLEGRKLLIGVAMVPRGEVGLIFAQMGLATLALTSELFSAITMTVLATTLLTPPLLAYMIRSKPHVPDETERPGLGGIDDLVAGTGEMNAIRLQDGPARSADTSTPR